ncbi:hypothetical protein AAKU67_000029 [Oxalobacteraceae bacterium GrIS 2.11]
MATKMATNNPAKAAGAPHQRSFMRDDFPVIRRACIAFVLSLAIGAGAVLGSQSVLESQLEAVAKAQSEENQMRDKRMQAENEQRDMQDFQPKYMQLTAQGFVGTEKRLDWIESIQSIQKKSHLQPISYEIGEQQLFQVDPAVDTGTLELRGSRMLVKMDLMHEADLLLFLDRLNAGQAYDLQKCVIKRLGMPDPLKLAPLLNAECELLWITIARHDTDAAGNPITSPGQ